MRESYMENWLKSTWRIVYLDRVAWYISQYLEVITVQLKKYKFQIAVVAIYIWIFDAFLLYKSEHRCDIQ